MRTGPLRLLLDTENRPIAVELYYAVAPRVPDVVPEDGGPSLPTCRPLKELGETVPEEDVVPEDERDALGPDKVTPDDESLGQPLMPASINVVNG